MVTPSEEKFQIIIDGLCKINIPSNYKDIDEDIKEDFKKHISDLIVKCLEDNNFPDMGDKIISRAIKKYEMVEEYEICDILKYSHSKFKYIYEQRFI